MKKKSDEPGNRDLFWYLPFYSSFNRPCVITRRGHWKYFYLIDEERGELYNTQDDIGEKNNLVERHPERAEEMKARAMKWLDDADAPRMTANPDYKEKLK